MAIKVSDLTEAVSLNLQIGGREKNIAKLMATEGVRIGMKQVWKSHIWSFSMKLADLTLTADNTDGYAVPDDCEAVAAVRRLTTSDYGWSLIAASESSFDSRFPNIAARPSDATVFYKVGFDHATGKPKIYVSPKSATSDAAKLLYRIKFNLEKCAGLMPDDYEPVCMTASLLQCTPAQAIEFSSARSQLYNEMKDQINDYRKRDRILIDQMVRRGELPNMPYALGSWNYILAGGPYDA